MTSSAPARSRRPYLWGFLQQGSEVAITLAVSIALARLLAPSDFGMVGMVTAATGFAAVLTDFGLGNALIHREEPDAEYIATCFWASALLGLGLTVLTFLGAPLLARFYGDPALVGVTRWLAPTFLLSSLTTVDQSLLRRRLDFRGLTMVSLATAVPSAIAGVALAALGYGVWALVTQRLLQVGLTCVLLRQRSKTPIALAFSRSALRALIRYGRGLLGANIANYWARNADTVAVGKMLGSAELGYYTRAYTLMLLPRNLLSNVVNSVLFPELARTQIDDVGPSFLRIVERVACLAFPMMFGLMACAEASVVALYGVQWRPAVWLVQALCPLGAYQTVVSLYGPLYLASGRTDLDFRVSLRVESATVVAILVGIYFKLPGLVLALYLSSLFNFWPVNTIPLQLAKLRLRDLARTLLPALVASLGMAATVFALGLALAALPAGVLLALQVASGVLVYALVGLLLKVPSLHWGLEVARARLRLRP